MTKKNSWRRFAIKIIFPTFLAISLFVISIFVFIIPNFENNMLNRKREMIKELTNSAWSILEKFENDEKSGVLSKQEAQNITKSQIKSLRYGEENLDYFWITDNHPNMIIHPFRPDLNGKDLSNIKDPHNKKLFVEMAKICKRHGSGYVDYMWQWKDDSSRIVPKLSYVKEFEPWGWIIGTGIYIEDVKAEIREMEKNLLIISFGITGILVMLLIFITIQSSRIEKRRQIAEEDLRESREKYRVLLEAATEGTMLILEGQFIYSNATLHNMLGYSNEEFQKLNIYNIFLKDQIEDTEGLVYFRDIRSGKTNTTQYETQIKKKDNSLINVRLTTSKITIAGKNGYTIIIEDISKGKRIEEELGQSKQQYQSLTENINIGVFRTTIGRIGKFIEANPAAIRIFGFSNRNELFQSDIFNFFYNSDEKKSFLHELLDNGFVKNKILQIKKSDNSLSVVSVSLIIVKDESGKDAFCDGVIEDITEKKQSEEERENLIVELQTSQLFMHQPIKNFISDIVTCDMNSPVSEVATLMTKNKCNSVLVKSDTNEFIGIITDADLRIRVIASKTNYQEPAFKIMTSPIATILEDAMVFEAVIMMQEDDIRHIAVKNADNKIIGLISIKEIILIQRHSSAYLIKEINMAEDVDKIVEAHERLPRLIKALIDSGAQAKNITRIITSVSDAITIKLIDFAIKKIGPPPCEFSFMTLGSEAREEQTLKTDQDNAIIFEDIDSKVNQKYFLELGELVCTWLDKAGYDFCEGDVMAKNPKWCQPISQWVKYFSKWINTSDPQALIDINIFFDFRNVYGSKELTGRLKDFIDKASANKNLFFYHMAKSSLEFKPPINIFGNISAKTDSSGESIINTKDAIMPIVGFAKVYSLKNNLLQTNTLDRFKQLYERKIITEEVYKDISHAYNFLMVLRFKSQADKINNKEKPDNNINLKDLTHIQLTTLRKIFSQISNFQTKLSYDFTGRAL